MHGTHSVLKRLIRIVILPAVFVSIGASAAFGQQNGRDMEKEQAIWQQVQAAAPKALNDFKAATDALDKGNYPEAARLYQQVYKQAPGVDAVNRRLGISLVLIGQIPQGIALLETAVKLKRSPENLSSLGQYLAYPGDDKEGDRAAKERAFALMKEANSLADGHDPSYTVLTAQLALGLNKLADFQQATEALVKNYPDLMATHYFNAFRLAMNDNWPEAEKEIKKAGSMGLSVDRVESFLAARPKPSTSVWQYANYAIYPTAAWAAGLLLLFITGKIFSRVTMRFIDTSGADASAGDKQFSFRRLYRALINLAGVYYYVSYPFVLLLVIGVPATLIYGFLLVGQIPIKLVAALGIAALITAYKMIRSLFVRRQSEDPGRSLSQEEAPGLWDLTREVARSIGTRPVDEIRVTSGTELAVYERGSMRERAQDKAHRILILGVGLLNDFRQNSFRAVLAHEYGHLTHRDTAGGDVALRVNHHMSNFAMAMFEARQAVAWNIGFQFLRVYHFIFRRISYGATRLQEMLADKVAVLTYGASAFEEGLRHVIRREIELDDVASGEITDAIKVGRPLRNIYELPPTDEKRIEVKIEEQINRKTSEDNTHPSAADRFRFADRIGSTGQEPIPGFLWDLFIDRESLTNEMSGLVNLRVRAVRAG
jgi:tetratricopeptide (TPR) repeat protein